MSVESAGVARKSAIYAVASIVQKLSSLILLPIYTRLLTPEEYGYFNIIVTLLMLGGAVAALGLEFAVVRYSHPSLSGTNETAHNHGDRQAENFTATYAIVIASSFLLTVVLVATGPLYSPLIFPGFDFYPVILIALSSILFQPLTTVYLALLQARSMARSFGTYSLALFASNGLLTVILLGPMEAGLLGVATSAVIVNATFALYGTWRAFRLGMLWAKFNRDDVARLLSYALPMLPHTLTLQATSLATRVIISNIVSVAAAGLFNIAMYAVNFIDAVQTAFHRSFLSWYFVQVDNKPTGWRVQVRNVIASFVSASVVIAASVALFADELLLILTPQDFHSAATIIPLLALSMMVKSVYYPSLSALLYHRKGTNSVLLISGTSSAISIPLAIVGAWYWGLTGVAIAQLVQRLTMSAMAVKLSARLDFAGIPWSRVLKAQSGGLAIVAIVMIGDSVDWWGVDFWPLLSVKIVLWVALILYILICDPFLAKTARSVVHREP